MNSRNRLIVPLLLVLLLLTGAVPSEGAHSSINVQCPGDIDGDGAWNSRYCSETLTPCRNNGDCPGGSNQCTGVEVQPADVQCMHISGGDGFATMADGRVQYIFGFADLTGIGDVNGNGDFSDDIMAAGALAAAWPAPAIAVDEGKQFYLTLTNVGMVIRPDLFDPHTVHFHGFPQSSSVFDGLPKSGISINMGASLTYYYNLVQPGTFMYHCHVEATEHMQMGMLGNLYVRAAQTGPLGTCKTGPCTQFAYNDNDGTTGYDKEFALQLAAFDPEFHEASWTVQPLPFAMMWDRYPMINGRGYPDTINPNPLASPSHPDCGGSCNNGIQSQVESSLVTAQVGDKVLLRLSNINITTSHTLTSPSIPMRVVGIDAKELTAADGTKLHYTTNSVTMGGGMTADVILDTAGVAPGDYYLYAANLHHLANYDQVADLGGMMTKIVINP